MLKDVEGRSGVYKRVGMVQAAESVDSWEVWEEKELSLMRTSVKCLRVNFC